MAVKLQLVARIPSQPSSNSPCNGRFLPLLAVPSFLRSSPTLPNRKFALSLRNKEKKFKSVFSPIRSQASDVGFGSSNYDGREKFDSENTFSNGSTSESSSQIEKHPSRVPYPLSIAMVLSGCALVFSLIVFVKGGPSSILAAIAKTGFTAAFTLILISEIGDKGNLTGLGMQAYLLILESWERKESHGTFFIAALLAMQYKKGLVLLGSMGALALMSILSVMIGRIFQSVPAQFQTTLPIGEYAAVTLLLFFGFKSIKDAWDLPTDDSTDANNSGSELGEYTSAEELVKEKVSKRLTNPLEILWKSFSLVFFAEWGDRSMLATIALGAAQSPWGVASGAIMGHLAATSIAVLGGAFLAKYISEKLVGYLGGVLFLLFAVATIFGFF